MKISCPGSGRARARSQEHGERGGGGGTHCRCLRLGDQLQCQRSLSKGIVRAEVAEQRLREMGLAAIAFDMTAASHSDVRVRVSVSTPDAGTDTGNQAAVLVLQHAPYCSTSPSQETGPGPGDIRLGLGARNLRKPGALRACPFQEPPTRITIRRQRPQLQLSQLTHKVPSHGPSPRPFQARSESPAGPPRRCPLWQPGPGL